MDGKWLNGSDVNGQYIQESHKAMLNILDKDIKIVFAHKFLDKHKKSEIKALQEVLEDDSLFTGDGQIFSFDALLTQSSILNTINAQGNKYIAKLKGNQKNLKQKAIETLEAFESATDVYDNEEEYLNENNKRVSRTVEIYQNKSCNHVMHHEVFNNIQSLIKVTKKLIDPTTGESTQTIQYSMANFKTSAQDFHEKILQHWRVETYAVNEVRKYSWGTLSSGHVD
ncbi:MAG: ISAs1 family transposase [Sulfurimonas sp.]|nr:ISAs1 family transposase [Sulfurimonas sp.]